LNAVLQKRDDVLQLGTLEDELRLRLAAQAAGCAAFDWNVLAGNIRSVRKIPPRDAAPARPD